MSDRKSAIPAWQKWVLGAVILAVVGGVVLVGLRHIQTASAGASPSAPAPVAAPAAAYGGDWIGFHGGGPLLGVASAVKAPPLHVRWRFRTDDDDTEPTNPTTTATATTHPAIAPAFHPPGHFEGGVAIVGGLVYAADTAGVLRAIDLASGKVKWAFIADDGFETTPLVIDGRVFIGDLGGLFHAVSAETGKKLWQFDAGGEIHCSANYLGDDRKRIIFGTDGADVFCLEAQTGKVIWNKKAEAQVYGTPGVSDGSVLVSGCDSQLRAMRGNDGEEAYSVDLGNPCAGSTAVAGDRLVAGTDQGRVLCISAKTHRQLWVFDKVKESEWVYGSPAVAEGIVVFGARDRSVYGVDLQNGSLLWTFATQGEVDSSPVISAGRVFVGSKDKKLYVLDLKTGKAIWSFTAGRGISASPAIGGGVVVIGDSGGNLFCLE